MGTPTKRRDGTVPWRRTLVDPSARTQSRKTSSARTNSPVSCCLISSLVPVNIGCCLTPISACLRSSDSLSLRNYRFPSILWHYAVSVLCLGRPINRRRLWLFSEDFRVCSLSHLLRSFPFRAWFEKIVAGSPPMVGRASNLGFTFLFSRTAPSSLCPSGRAVA